MDKIFMSFSEDSMQRVLQFEKFCNDFFLSVKDFYRKELAENKFNVCLLKIFFVYCYYFFQNNIL